MAQAIGFSHDFFVIAVCALGGVVLLGIVTLTRQANADAEDIVYVLAMNRIGAPTPRWIPVGPNHRPRTTIPEAHGQYYPFEAGENIVFASASMFLTIVNGGITGLLAGTISALARRDSSSCP